MSKMTKKKKIVLASVLTAVAAILITAAILVGLIFRPANIPQHEDLGFETVCYELPDDNDPTEHSGIENIGYMNWRLQHQDYWYSEAHVHVNNSMDNQNVATYKQYHNGVLISTDISMSNLVNKAVQYCQVRGGDVVLFRNSKGGKKTFDGVNTPWNTDKPDGHAVDEYKVKKGLPPLEFSVYILNENTVKECLDIVDNGDGTYSQTFILNFEPEPADKDATYWYKTEMAYKANGMMKEYPQFSEVSVTYTFDNTWQLLSAKTREVYKTITGVAAINCVAEGTTNYVYGNTELTYNPEFESYYINYLEDYKAPEDEVIDAALCLSEAFGGVMQEEVKLSLDLDLDDSKLSGVVQLNLDENDIRADFGHIKVYMRGEGAEKAKYLYVAYGDNVKAKIALSDLASDAPAEGEGEEEESVLDKLLTALGDDEKFNLAEDKRSATLTPTINLGELLGVDLDITLNLEFKFNISEKKEITLAYVKADGDVLGIKLQAELHFADKGVEALAQSEADKFTEIDVASIISLTKAEALNLDLSYSGYGVEANGVITVNLADLQVKADLNLVFDGDESSAKEISLIYANDTVYISINTVNEQPVKIKANATEAWEIISALLGTPETQQADGVQTALDLIESIGAGNLVGMLLSEDGLSSMLTLSGTDTAVVTIDGTALLGLFGVEFELGEVVAEIENGGVIGLSAFGFEATLSGTETFTFDESEYQNATEILPVVNKLISIIAEQKLSISGALSVETEETQIELNIRLLSIDWSEGIKVCLNSQLTAFGKTENLLVNYDGEVAKVSFGDLGVTVNSADFEEIVNAVLELIGAINGGDAVAYQMPEVSFEELDIASIINSLVISGSDGSIVKLSLAGFEITFIDETADELGIIGIAAEYRAEGVSVTLTDAHLTEYKTCEYPDGDVQYFDVKYVLPLINRVTDYINDGRVTISGSVELGGLTVAIDNLAISLVDGIDIVAQLTLKIDDFQKTVYFEYNSEKIAVYYDGIVVELAQDDVEGFMAALQNLYDAIAEEVNNSGNEIPMPDIDGLLSFLPVDGEIDIAELLNSIKLAKNENGNLVIGYGDVSAEIIVNSQGDLSVNLTYIDETDGISVNASVTVTEYSKVELPENSEKLDVAELIPLINNITEIITNKGITVSGNILLDSGATVLTMYGLSVSWADGIALQLDARLEANGSVHDFYAEYSATTGKLNIVYGALDSGAGIAINIEEDAQVLEDALVVLFNRVAGVANSIAGEDVLPNVGSLSELLDLITNGRDAVNGVAELSNALDEIQTEQPSIGDILGAIQISAENGTLTFEMGGLMLTVWSAEDGFNLSVETAGASFEIRDLQIVATEATDFDITVEKALSAEDIVDILDYVGATVELAAEDNIKIELEGTVTTTDEAYAGQEGVKYNITAGFEYAQGESGYPVHIDKETPDFWIAPDIYVHIYVNMQSTLPEVDSVLLDAYIFDGNPEFGEDGKTTAAELTSGDNELDIYLSVSRIPAEQAKNEINGAHEPLMIYAPMSEVMTVLAAGLALIDVGSISVEALPELNDTIKQIGAILDVMLVDRYFGDTKDQFVSLGSGLLQSILGGSISDIINNLVNGIIGDIQPDDNEEVATVALRTVDGGFDRERYGLLDLDVSRDEEGSSKLTLRVGETISTVTKQATESGSRITNLTVDTSALNETDTLNNLNINLSYGEIQKVDKLAGYTGFVGADSLVKALVNSATHEVPEEEQTENSAKYALNDNFFIDGVLNLDVKLVGFNLESVNIYIDGLSVSIGADGDVEVNLRMHYDAAKFLVTLIEGDSTVDLTVKNGMVYIKRVQTSDYKGGWLGTSYQKITPISTYRVMPVDVFMADIMDQMFFMFNFGSTIVNSIKSSAGGGDDEPKETYKKDYGEQLADYFKYLKFAETVDAESGLSSAVWNVLISGTGLTGLAGVKISDIDVKFGAVQRETDGEYVVQDLGIKGNLLGLIYLDANLNWQNPQQNWRVLSTVENEDGTITEITAEKTANEIIANNPSIKLTEWLGGNTFEEICTVIDWSKLPQATANGDKYFELTFTGDAELPDGTVKFGTVEFYRMSERSGGEEIFISSIENIIYYNTTLLSIVEMPDLSEFEIEHYILTWQVTASAGILKFVAVYVPEQYEVTFDSLYEIEGYTHTYGNTLTFNFGYETDWHKIAYIEYKGVQYTAENYTEIVIDGNAEIYVHWVEIPRVTVTFVSDYEVDGFTQNEDGKWALSDYYRTDKEITLPSEYVIDGYEFMGYLDANGDPVSDYTLTLTEDTTYFLQWKGNKVTVIYYSSLQFEGSESASGVEGYETVYTSRVEMSNNYTVANVNVEGYMFLGWYYLDETAGWVIVSDVLTDIPEATVGATYELHALWLQATVTVNGSKNVSWGTATYDLDGSVEFEFFAISSMLDNLQVSTVNFRYFVNNSADYNVSSSNATQNNVAATAQDGKYIAISDIGTFRTTLANYNYKHLAVTFTVTVGGTAVSCSGEYLHASSSNW